MGIKGDCVESQSQLAASAYLLPGRRERLDDGIGAMLRALGLNVSGLELSEEFLRSPFPDQIRRALEEIQANHWRRDSILIGKSYGGYLLLHSLLEVEPYPGRILLLSPVLGATSFAGGMYGVRPPRAARLLEAAAAGRFPQPGWLEIHTGELDPDCRPETAAAFYRGIARGTLRILPGMGHELGFEKQRSILTGFLFGSNADVD